MKKVLTVLLSLCFIFTSAHAESVVKMQYTLSTEDYTRDGYYTGEIVNGVPHGYGVFEAVNTSGESWHYIGQWSDGLMNGEGKTFWDFGQIEIGAYENGLFSFGRYIALPQLSMNTTGYALNLLRSIGSGSTPEIKPDEFAGADYRNLLRTPENYMYSLVKVDGKIAQIVSGDRTNYQLRVAADDGESVFWVSVLEEANLQFNLIVGDNISAYGMFLGNKTYDNIDGYTNTIPLLECFYIEIK